MVFGKILLATPVKAAPLEELWFFLLAWKHHRWHILTVAELVP